MKSNLSLYHLYQPPKIKKDRSPLLLLLHGIGSNEEDLFSMSNYLDKRFFIVSARAPYEYYGGFAWFQIELRPNEIIIDLDQALASKKLISQFIGELIKNYPVDPRQVYLMGFSQGAILSLSLALTQPEKLASVVVMSGRIVPDTISNTASKELLKDFPIFMTHGTLDDVLPIAKAREAKELLSQLPVNLIYREYEMGHQVSQESLNDVTGWLTNQLNKSEIRNS
jgi:phospholipase/carboxylesterase